MTLSGLWTRKSSPKERKLQPLLPSHVRETHRTQIKSKLRHPAGREATECTTPLNANASPSTPTHQGKRDLLLQVISPRPSVHPHRQPTMSTPSHANTLPPGRVVYASRDPQMSHDSPFASLSEYEHGSCAPGRANAFAIGVDPSADSHARDLGLEENDDEAVEADLSQQLAHVPSFNGFSPLEEPEPSPALAPEPLDPSSVFEGQLAPESLIAASVVQARRWRLRAQIRRARLMAEDLADTSFTLESLDNLSLAVPTETCPVGLDASVSGSLSAAAPVSSDAGLNEVSSESVVHTAPSDMEPASQPSEFVDPFNTATVNFHRTSRDSQASSTSSHSLFEYDHLLSEPAMEAGNPPPPLNPTEDRAVDSERSLYDPVLQCFYLRPKIRTLGVTASTENDARNVDEERIESAGVKDLSLTTVAPPPSTRVSESESSRVAVKLTPPTPPVTMRAPSLPRNQPVKEKNINPDSSFLVLPDPRPSNSRAESNSPDLAPVLDSERSLYDPVLQCFYLPPKVNALGVTGSSENDAQNLDEERIERARVKDPSLTTVTPPSAGVSNSESSKVVIKVTPPTPPVTMRASSFQRSQSVKVKDIDPNSSYLVLPDPRPSKSRTKSKSLDLPPRAATMLAPARVVDNYSLPLRIEGDQDLGTQHRADAHSPSSTVSKVVTGSVEREIHDLAATTRAARPLKSRPMPTAQTLGSSSTLVDELSDPEEFDVSRTFGYPVNDGRIRDGEEGVSARGKAEPLPFGAPISPARVTHRKPKKVKDLAGGLVPHGVRQHARAFKSTITSSLREWGNAASRLLSARRPAQVEGNRMTNPYFDPWEGYVPPRGPSPELIQPDGSFPPPQPCITNVYVKLD